MLVGFEQAEVRAEHHQRTRGLADKAGQFVVRDFDLLGGRSFHWLRAGDSLVVTDEDRYLVVISPVGDGTWTALHRKGANGIVFGSWSTHYPLARIAR